MTQNEPERIVFVYTTYPSVVEAENAGCALLEAQLAACVNILPGMISLYRWQGALERGEEVVMIIKTRATLAEAVKPRSRKSIPMTRRPFWSFQSKASTPPIWRG
jgi:periplasmic divalent cation tolerance protein